MQAGTTVTTLGCKMVLLAQRFFLQRTQLLSSQELINTKQRMNFITMQGEKPLKTPEDVKCCLSRGKAGFLLSRRRDGLDSGIGRDASRSSSRPSCLLVCGLAGPGARLPARRSRSPSRCSPPPSLQSLVDQSLQSRILAACSEPSGFSLPWPGFRAVPH